MPPTTTQAEKKLSAKTIIGDPRTIKNALIKEDKKRKDLFTIFGEANGFETGTSQHGEWFALTGQFEAVNVSTGESFSSMKCFLPRDVTNFFINGIKSNEGKPVEFGVMIGMKLNESAIGFEYTCQPIIPLKSTASLNRLRDEMKKALPPVEKTDKDKK